MVRHGLRVVPSQGNAYDWELARGGYTFHLRIDDFDPTFVSLPRVRLLRHPDGLPETLTHVNPDKTLCYFERTGKYLDPYEPEQSLVLVLASVEITIDNILDTRTKENDFAQEFDSYWGAEGFAYLLDQGAKLNTTRFERVNPITERTDWEWAVHNSDEGGRLTKWMKVRDAKDKQMDLSTVVVSMQEFPCMPVFDSAMSWPPKNWRELYSWVTRTHPVTANELMRRLCESLLTSLKQIIIFTFPGSGSEDKRYFAVTVKFGNSIQALANRYIGSRKQGRKRQKVSPDAVRAAFRRVSTEYYMRLSVRDVSMEFVTGRNIQTETLSNKKIAIIGCGTVGATVASLLVKIGVATGSQGKLSLFDSDYLKAANIGRNLLGEKYIGINKAEALRYYLKDNFTWPMHIKSHPYDIKDRSQIDKLLRFNDLVLDLTGMQQFSTYLSHVYREINRVKATPCGAVLYGWVDANGLAVRILLDDLHSACYRCLLVNTRGELRERFALKGKTVDWPKHAEINIACGESFTPYAEGVSVIAVGLIQGMVIDYFTGNPTPRFRHKSLHSSIPEAKSQNITSLKSCPCCHG